MIQPINQLSIGSICKIPNLSNLGEITILNINHCGVRVKGIEATDQNKKHPFDHTISGQTPVEKVGFDQQVADLAVARQEKSDSLASELKGDSGFLDQKIENQNNESNNQSNNQQNQNMNTEINNTENSQPNQPSQSVDPVVEIVKSITAELQNTKNATNSINYLAPKPEFSAKEFAEYNVIPYPVALAFLKLNGQEVGKKSFGRGRPTTIYSLKN